MPGYGIAEAERGLLPWSWAVERLIAATRYWVATVDEDGAPHLMPVLRPFSSAGERQLRLRGSARPLSSCFPLREVTRQSARRGSPDPTSLHARSSSHRYGPH
jgi:hypothetical protein